MTLKNTIRKITLLTFAAALIGCSEEGQIIPEGGALPVTITTPDCWPETRYIAGDQPTFEVGDRIGVFSYYIPEGGSAKELPDFMYNQLVTKKTDQEWVYSPTKYWPENTGDALRFIGYYPYGTEEIMLRNTGSSVLFDIAPNHHTDLLMSEPKNFTYGESVALNFTHLLTRIKFNITHNCDGPCDLYVRQIKLKDCTISKTLKLANGDLSTVQNSEITSDPVLTKPDFRQKLENGTSLVLERYVLPRAGEEKLQFFMMLSSGTTDEPEVFLTTTENVKMEAGGSITLNINVTATGVSVTVPTNWGEGYEGDYEIEIQQ